MLHVKQMLRHKDHSRTDFDDVFDALDADHDHTISRSEWINYMLRRASEAAGSIVVKEHTKEHTVIKQEWEAKRRRPSVISKEEEALREVLRASAAVGRALAVCEMRRPCCCSAACHCSQLHLCGCTRTCAGGACEARG